MKPNSLSRSSRAALMATLTKIIVVLFQLSLAGTLFPLLVPALLCFEERTACT